MRVAGPRARTAGQVGRGSAREPDRARTTPRTDLLRRAGRPEGRHDARRQGKLRRSTSAPTSRTRGRRSIEPVQCHPRAPRRVQDQRTCRSRRSTVATNKSSTSSRTAASACPRRSTPWSTHRPGREQAGHGSGRDPAAATSCARTTSRAPPPPARLRQRDAARVARDGAREGRLRWFRPPSRRRRGQAGIATSASASASMIEMTTFGWELLPRPRREHARRARRLRVGARPRGSERRRHARDGHDRATDRGTRPSTPSSSRTARVRGEGRHVRPGRHPSTPFGWGTWGSRSAVAGGGAVITAAEKVREKMLRVAGQPPRGGPAGPRAGVGRGHGEGRPAKAARA